LEDFENLNTAYDKLNSSVIIEYFKKDIMKLEKNEGLSRSEKTKL
jgi:hypothetical protein